MKLARLASTAKNRSVNFARSSAGSLARYAKSTEGVGSLGHDVAEYGSHALLALASSKYDTVGPIPLKPHVAGGIIAALGMAFGKGKTRKLARSVLRGAGHALITDLVRTDQFGFISGVDFGGNSSPTSAE